MIQEDGIGKVIVKPMAESMRAGQALTDKPADSLNESSAFREPPQTEFDQTTDHQDKP
jgi:hypothetical protein